METSWHHKFIILMHFQIKDEIISWCIKISKKTWIWLAYLKNLPIKPSSKKQLDFINENAGLSHFCCSRRLNLKDQSLAKFFDVNSKKSTIWKNCGIYWVSHQREYRVTMIFQMGHTIFGSVFRFSGTFCILIFSHSITRTSDFLLSGNFHEIIHHKE